MNAYLSWVAFYYEIPFSVLDVINLWPKNNLKNLEQVCDFHNLMTHSEKKLKIKQSLKETCILASLWTSSSQSCLSKVSLCLLLFHLVGKRLAWTLACWAI